MKTLAIMLVAVVFSSVVLAQGAGVPAQPEWRVAWHSSGVVEARSGGCGDWNWWGPDHQAIKAWCSKAGQSSGLLVMGDYRPLEQTSAETSKPGRDPRTAPLPGLHRSPIGLLQVAVTFGGFRKSESLRISDKARYHREWYRITLVGRILSLENADPIAVVEATGETTGDISDLDVSVAGVRLGNFLSRPALADDAIRAACQQLMPKLARQLANTTPSLPAEIRVAKVEGTRVVFVTTDRSDIRDSGVTEGLKYDLLGAGVEGSRGRVRIARVTIDHVDQDLAEGKIIELFSGSPSVGQTLTLVPYQSQFKRN